MTLRLATVLLLGTGVVLAEPFHGDIDQPPHSYRDRPLRDRFTLMKDDFEAGRIPLDYSGEKPFLLSLLKALNIPASSQMLVFSTTSLQLRFITPSNPRALYFNEDLYVGYIPGARLEIVSLDPEAGAIFYIFDIPRGGQPIRVERSDRCANCHVAGDTGYVPGLVVKSVVPGPSGGSLLSYRREQTGHGIPFEDRFGGWYVTGRHAITNHWGNTIGRMHDGEITRMTIEPGQRFDFGKYPVPTSDVLPQLLLEHQAGFVNRVVEAGYRARAALNTDAGQLSAAHAAELSEQARLITRYLLFADEVPLPKGGVEGDAQYKTDFLGNRQAIFGGASLKDFDLRTRLFRHRCSYMIYNPVFTSLPPVMKGAVYRRLGEALSTTQPDREYAYLPATEKQTIRNILRGTLKDLPAGW
jgi:hypothetical protein